MKSHEAFVNVVVGGFCVFFSSQIPTLTVFFCFFTWEVRTVRMQDAGNAKVSHFGPGQCASTQRSTCKFGFQINQLENIHGSTLQNGQS